MANRFNHGRHCVGLKVIISFPRSCPLFGGVFGMFHCRQVHLIPVIAQCSRLYDTQPDINASLK